MRKCKSIYLLIMILGYLILINGCNKHSQESDLSGRIQIVQRNDRVIPGSDSQVVIHIDDITGGQVETTLKTHDNVLLIAPVSVRLNDSFPFAYRGQKYLLTLVKLKNYLVGQDYAVFSISKHKEGQRSTEHNKIDKLIQAIAMSKVRFIRNDREYSALEGASHLKRKWRRAGSRIQTVDDFIDHIASRSSLSGKLYHVKLQDGTVIESAKWLHDLSNGLSY